jgi:hypothetical protein
VQRQEAGDGECGRDPLQARVERRPGDERDGRCGDDDPVRDDSSLEIDGGEHGEDSAERRRQHRI